MSMMKEFKQFAMKGNVVELAVAVIIGAAFGKIVSSFIGDIITPLLLQPLLESAHLNDIRDLTAFGSVKYGVFLSTLIDFILVAFVLFLVIKGMNAAKKKEESTPAPPPAPSKEEILLTEIRDLLKK
ncbi:MAG: large conductance mechanosensitive channel protein MscL [Flavobacteriales bacterium]